MAGAKIVFDIGGTNTKIAVSFEDEKIGEVVVKPTPLDVNQAAFMIASEAKLLLKGYQAETAAGGVAGVLNADKTVLLKSPNLHLWQGKNLVEIFSSAFDCPVKIANDTVVAGIGEAVFGVGKGKKIVVYMTVSTGVGGAKIEDGKPDVFRIGFEPGHQIIITGDGYVPVYLEDLISGKSFEKRWGPDFVNTAPEEAWKEAAKYLAVGLHNTIVHWSPDIIVLGGAMITKLPGISVEVVQNCLKNIIEIFPEIPPIVLPGLGDHSALYGALRL